MNQRKQTTKHTAETKLPWFSHLLRHSARKRGGLIPQRPRAPHGPQANCILQPWPGPLFGQWASGHPVRHSLDHSVSIITKEHI